MKNKRAFITFFTVCFLVIFLLISSLLIPKIFTSEASELEKFTPSDQKLLKSLARSNNEIHLNYKNTQLSNEKGDFEESTSKLQDENNKKIKASELKALLEKDPSLIQIQIFDLATNKQIMFKTVKSLRELEGLTFETPKHILEANKDYPVFQADYMVIISTKDYVGFYDFTRFYINDLSKANANLLNGVLAYMKSTDLKNGLNIEFIKRGDTINELDVVSSKQSIDCIACVGPIYKVGSKETFNKWVNIAQVHAIKGVDTTFSLSTSQSSTVSIQSKTVTKAGTVTSSGAISNILRSTTIFPKRTASSLTAKGVHAQQEVQMAKVEYINVKNNADRYTQVRREKYIGGANFGNSVGGNGKNYDSVNGIQYLPGSKHTVEQESSQSFSNQASTSVYGITVGVTVTLNHSSQNTWTFDFKTGHGFSWYKVYGKYKNLTAK
ncbi:hypothetical protein [Fervidibacillus halotolerans]|uniref:Uncharacterized protein n=1 Tax=Fervidibacillus halotolerans TaxID=2980027 RepID=A0A9E8RYI9_9BACI|nr:hypothetical protein [Fervidibacillus halotolerans]WAA12886.1 hypothetical protein OE105_01695 [Fervidibacillus halotolerans]